MNGLLNTLPVSTPFDYQRQGLYNELAAVPIADGNNLLPFVSMPFDPLTGANVTAWVMCINGTHAFNLGVLPYIDKNGKWSFYWDGHDSAANLPMGYYYIQASYEIPPAGATQAYQTFVDRVQHDGGVVEATECMQDSIISLFGGWVTGDLFKTEIFFMPQAGAVPGKLGSFNEDYNLDFDT